MSKTKETAKEAAKEAKEAKATVKETPREAPEAGTVAASALTELPAVGQNIYVACKKCAADRYHKILAHSTPTSAKIQCEVCKSKKTFRLPKPKKARAKRPSKKNAGPAMPEWSTLREQLADGNVLPYKMSERFELEVAIEHPKFGLGFVMLSTPAKIDVVFEEGLKSLIHNRVS